MLKYSRHLISIALVVLFAGIGIAALPTVALAKPAKDCTPGPGLDLAGCSYVNANLTGDNFSGSDLRKADFSGTDLNETNFTNADLRRANMSGAGMVFDCGLPVACPNNGDVQNWVWGVNPNFTGADLRRADLSSATLGGTRGLTIVCDPAIGSCIFVAVTYPDATLTGVKSGGVLGTPSSLPNGWELIDGYLTVPPSPLQITSPSNLPVATRGVAYSTFLTAAGGNPAYEWSVVNGALPSGLHLERTSGTISGTPRSAGTSVFTVQVIDTKTHRPTTQRVQTMAFSLQVT
jgi:hypothetical protein